MGQINLRKETEIARERGGGEKNAAKENERNEKNKRLHTDAKNDI